jgi:putative membrane protein
MKRIWNKMIMGLGISIITTAVAFADDLSADLTAQQFVTKAAMAGNKEVREGELALQKSSNPDVKNFASQMVRDHSAANAKLTRIANREGLNVPPTNSMYLDDTNMPGWPYTNNAGIANYKGAPPAGAEALTTPVTMETNGASGTISYLQTLSGAEFDKAYASAAVKDHQKAVHLFEKASRTLPDDDLKNFAAQTMPKLEDHYRMAQDLAGKVGASMSP